MNSVATVGAAQGAASAAGASIPQLIDPSTGESLLPPPSLGDEQMDTMALLFLMQTKLREQNMKGGHTAIEVKNKEKLAALERESERLAAAVEAHEEKGFWDKLGSALLTVAKVAAVVGSIAVAVASCGAGTGLAALAIAGAVLSTAGFAQSELHVLEKLGVDAETAGYVGLGLSLGGAACSVGAGVVTTLGAAGNAAQLSKIGNIASTGSKVSMMASGGAMIAAGGSRIAGANASAEAEHASAEALKEQLRAQRMQRLIEQIIEELKGSDESDARVLDGLRGAMLTKGETLIASVRA